MGERRCCHTKIAVAYTRINKDNVEACIITKTIFLGGAPCYKNSFMSPPNPILIIEAPIFMLEQPASGPELQLPEAQAESSTCEWSSRACWMLSNALRGSGLGAGVEDFIGSLINNFQVC